MNYDKNIFINKNKDTYYADWYSINNEVRLMHLIGKHEFFGEQALIDVEMLADAHGWNIIVKDVTNEDN